VLATELALLSSRLGPDFPVSEIALGGGSPNFLQPYAIRRLLAAIEHSFSLAKDARRSVELDPRTTTTAQLETFAAAGFRSMSMGIQDFSPSVQDAIHRHQSVAQTRWLVERGRSLGFTDINVDIVYGLPHQTEPSFEATLDAVISLEPDRIALFGYAHLPAKLPHQLLVERAGRVLDRYERASLLLLGIDKLVRAGYEYLGLDHFARPGSKLETAAREGRLDRTFQGYVERRATSILGVGVSAISTTPRAMWQNDADLPVWEKAIGERRLPVARGIVLDRDDQIRRALIGRLMCDGGLDFATLEQQVGIADAPAYFARELAELPADLASYDVAARRIVTTPLGRMLVRNVCMVFDRYAADTQARFSPTI